VASALVERVELVELVAGWQGKEKRSARKEVGD